MLPADGAGRYRASFEFAQPATGIDLMAGPWVIRERIMPRANGAPLRLRTYFPRELDAIAGLADGYLDDSRRYLERLRRGDRRLPVHRVLRGGEPAADRLCDAHAHLHGRRRAEAALHPRHVARSRGAPQLVGQRRLRRLPHGQLVRRADHVHGGLRLQGARVGGGRARDAARVAAGLCRGALRRHPVAEPPFAPERTALLLPSGTASRRCCS